MSPTSQASNGPKPQENPWTFSQRYFLRNLSGITKQLRVHMLCRLLSRISSRSSPLSRSRCSQKNRRARNAESLRKPSWGSKSSNKVSTPKRTKRPFSLESRCVEWTDRNYPRLWSKPKTTTPRIRNQSPAFPTQSTDWPFRTRTRPISGPTLRVALPSLWWWTTAS
jgi:hypothetical protein